MGRFDGRAAMVTGGASGIGAATVRRLLAAGWRVACLDRNLEGARATAGTAGLAVQIDVADEASTARAFAEVQASLGGLDALVTAAGVIETTAFFDTTPAILGFCCANAQPPNPRTAAAVRTTLTNCCITTPQTDQPAKKLAPGY